MEGEGSEIRKWEDLDLDILAMIFQKLDIFDLTSGGIAHICSSWRSAACDPLLWKTIDVSMLTSNFIKIPLEPYVYVDCRSDKKLTKLLKLALNLSHGSTTTLIFQVNLYVSDDQLTYTAERCPNLKRLVLPVWNRIKKTGIVKAIRMWPDLESLTMPAIVNPPYLLEEISMNCRNFSELKVMGPCELLFAETLVRCVPSLKVLSLRCTMVYMDALRVILDGLKNLQVLNIAHCLFVQVSPHANRVVMNHIPKAVLEKAMSLQEFYTCMDDACIMCQRIKRDEGLLRWYKYEEGLWKADEVKSLVV